ncbi:MAG: sugar phosphate isomerase/epimerase, partial [Verrucomicrobiota bacterium]
MSSLNSTEPAMEVFLFKTLWGHEGTIAEAVALAKEADFSGIEGMYPDDPVEQESFRSAIAAEEMDFIAEVSTATTPGLYVPAPGKSPTEHLDSLRAGIEKSLPAKPIFINTMCGSDAWCESEAAEFYGAIPALEKEYAISITAETHRGRYINSPWHTRFVLTEVPELKLTCDFSHFCVVAERLILDEETEILDLCARSAFHLQTRVGYDQGPQVPDPRAPEHADDLAA